MPRRLRIELADLAAWDNLAPALWAAARAKRTRPDVAAFLADAPRQLLRVRMEAFCAEELDLRLKPPCLMPSRAGLGFCGMRVYPGTIKLGRRRQRRWRQRRAYWEELWWRGEIGEAELQRACASLHSMTLPADARGWRRKELQRRPAPGMEGAI